MGKSGVEYMLQLTAIACVGAYPAMAHVHGPGAVLDNNNKGATDVFL